MHPEPLPEVVETITLAPTVVRVIPRDPLSGLVGAQARTWSFGRPLAATVRLVTANTEVSTFAGRSHLLSVVDRVLVTLEEDAERRGLLDALDPYAYFPAMVDMLRLLDAGAGLELWEPEAGGWRLLFVPFWRPDEDAPVPLDDEDLTMVEGEARRGGRTVWDLPLGPDWEPPVVGPYTWYVTYVTAAVPPPASLAV